MLYSCGRHCRVIHGKDREKVNWKIHRDVDGAAGKTVQRMQILLQIARLRSGNMLYPFETRISESIQPILLSADWEKS
jgi:hypothetical protein